MLLEAYNWDGQPRFTLEQLTAEDHAWRYVDGWPRPGDIGVVAEDGQPIGAAWARLLTADRPGKAQPASRSTGRSRPLDRVARSAR
ncbi:hypothetical protein [Kribbella sp. NPDC051718]|uniref:hypothetical protein n=1 Tax=Kribbella sp. NPDC051718 TaxID=3155168 RepID=UPI00342A843B